MKSAKGPLRPLLLEPWYCSADARLLQSEEGPAGSAGGRDDQTKRAAVSPGPDVGDREIIAGSLVPWGTSAALPWNLAPEFHHDSHLAPQKMLGLWQEELEKNAVSALYRKREEPEVLPGPASAQLLLGPQRWARLALLLAQLFLCLPASRPAGSTFN